MPTNSFRSPTSALAILVQPIFLSIKILERDSGGDETSLWNYDIIKRTKLSSIPREQCVTLNKTANFSLNRCRSFPTGNSYPEIQGGNNSPRWRYFLLLSLEPPRDGHPLFFFPPRKEDAEGAVKWERLDAGSWEISESLRRPSFFAVYSRSCHGVSVALREISPPAYFFLYLLDYFSNLVAAYRQ